MTQRNYSNIVNYTRVSSGFSPSRLNPVTKKWKAHQGVDLAAPNGTPVHTPYGGVVVDALPENLSGGRGNFVVIQHTLPDGGVVFTEYMHLQNDMSSLKGTTVTAGTEIGQVGSTGISTGPHLHYQEMLARDVNGDGVFTYDEALSQDPNLDYFKFATGAPDTSAFASGNGLNIPGQVSDPGMHYYEFTGDAKAGRLYDNGVLYIKDNQTGREFWQVPTAPGGQTDITKFANGVIATQTFAADGQINTSVPGTVTLDSTASADIVAAYQAWIAAGNDPANMPADKIFFDIGDGSAIDARQYTKPGMMGSEIASNDILIGEGTLDGKGGNMLVGGMGNDLLIGGNGDDVLYGGAGNDVMAGGAGDDTYILDGGGHDTIEDKVGNNRVLLNGKVLANFTTADGTNYRSADGSFSGIMSNGDFIVTDTSNGDQITLNQNFASGDFGITLSDAPVDPVTTTTLTGDIAPDDIDPTKTGIQAARDAQGNLIGVVQAYDDILVGTAADDHIMSGEGNDDVGGNAGNDWIEGGNGSDYINGETGNDLIEGGAGSDILAGDDGNDQIYGNVKIDTATAISNGSTDAATNLRGDWLAGNAGDDTLVGTTGNDVLSGGAGRDLLIGGAGDDYILGDADYTAAFIWPDAPSYTDVATNINWYHSAPQTFDWTVTEQADGNYLFQPLDIGVKDPADSGNDIIYAGAGDDHVWAGAGNDVVYGEDGNDTLSGEAGNDILMGGAGNDTLSGDASYIDASLHGDDYLDGGDGNDTLDGQGGNDTLIGGAECAVLLGCAKPEAANDSMLLAA